MSNEEETGVTPPRKVKWKTVKVCNNQQPVSCVASYAIRRVIIKSDCSTLMFTSLLDLHPCLLLLLLIVVSNSQFNGIQGTSQVNFAALEFNARFQLFASTRAWSVSLFLTQPDSRSFLRKRIPVTYSWLVTSPRCQVRYVNVGMVSVSGLQFAERQLLYSLVCDSLDLQQLRKVCKVSNRCWSVCFASLAKLTARMGVFLCWRTSIS